MRKKARNGQETFALTADVSETHLQVPSDPKGWHLLWREVKRDGDVYVNNEWNVRRSVCVLLLVKECIIYRVVGSVPRRSNGNLVAPARRSRLRSWSSRRRIQGNTYSPLDSMPYGWCFAFLAWLSGRRRCSYGRVRALTPDPHARHHQALCRMVCEVESGESLQHARWTSAVSRPTWRGSCTWPVYWSGHDRPTDPAPREVHSRVSHHEDLPDPSPSMCIWPPHLVSWFSSWRSGKWGTQALEAGCRCCTIEVFQTPAFTLVQRPDHSVRMALDLQQVSQVSTDYFYNIGRGRVGIHEAVLWRQNFFQSDSITATTIQLPTNWWRLTTRRSHYLWKWRRTLNACR